MEVANGKFPQSDICVCFQRVQFGFEFAIVLCSSAPPNDRRTTWDAKDEIIGRRNGSPRPLQDFVVTVDAVEKETGLNFFSLVPRQEQDRLESTITLDEWSW